VGASNELPESEELDALYDRFLIRRSVAQVSSSQLGNLARLAAGTRLVAEAPSNGASSNGAATPPADPEAGPGLDLEDFRSVQHDQCPSCCLSVCLFASVHAVATSNPRATTDAKAGLRLINRMIA